jgi:hypothetical protein
LIFGIWEGLLKTEYITETEVIQALLQGNLPILFEQKVVKQYSDYSSEKAPMGSYVPELIRRGFNSIPWDLDFHKLISESDTCGKKSVTSSMGLRIDGDQIIPEMVVIDSSFERCPIAHAAGIPLLVKKMKSLGKRVGSGGRYIITRMMSDPIVGVAHDQWAYGGVCGPAPPVLIARSDSIPFTADDWGVLDDFEMEMLDDGPKRVIRSDFINFVISRLNSGIICTQNVCLEVIFPKGQQVRATGLKIKYDLNGKRGQVIGAYRDGRIGIKFDESDSVVAVKPENLMKL